MQRYKDKYPEKIAAASRTSHLKAKVKGNHLHHWSYNEEHYKDVIELSVADHNAIHRQITYDQERMMYRRADNNVLLSTRFESIYYYYFGLEIRTEQMAKELNILKLINRRLLLNK